MGRFLLCMVGLILAANIQVQAQGNLWVSYKVFGEKEGYQTYHGPGRLSGDKDGLVWLTGDNGLYSFDGTHFTNYRNIAGDSNSLPFNVVIMNYQDNDGRYWVSIANKGLYHFDPRNRSFIRFTYEGMEQFDIHRYKVNNLMEDGPTLWMIVPDYGLAAWDKRTKKMRSYRICPPGNCGTYYNASWLNYMVKDPEDSCYWIGSNNGLIQFWPATGKYEVHIPPPALSQTTVGQTYTVINFLLTDKAGTLWCGTWGLGLLAFDRHSKTFKQFHWRTLTGGTQNICSGLFAAGDDQIWIASRDQGLMLFNKETGTFRNVRNPQNPDEVIGAFYCHQSDNNTIWMADQKKLYRLDLDTARLTWHPVLSASRDEHITGGVYSFLALKNKLFCGIYYDGNFGWIDRTTNRFISRPLTSASDNEGVRHLSADNNNTVWVGTATGTYLYDPQADKLITPKKIQNSDYYFKAPCTDVWHNDDGSHWIATAKGIVLYDPIQSRLLVLDTTQPLNHRLQVQHITDVFKDSKGRLWFGELGSGIGCYLPARDSVIHFSKDLLPWRGNSTGFCEDKNGSIIFSMQSNGVIIIEKPFTPQQKLTLCNTGNYLPTDHINYIFADNKGRIWLYTSNGLLLFDPISKSYTAFKSKQGIYDDYIDSYPYQDSAGRMYIGFGVGYQTFLPDSLLAPRPSKLTIRLHDLSVNGSQWPQHPAYTSDLTLDPNPGNVSFSFAAMGLPASDDCGYAYLLEGYDKDWHYTTTTSGQYNNLPPGGYTLRIKASTLNGQWDSEPFSIPLTVIPAWYQSIWFKVLLGALVAAIILGFFSYRLRQVRKQAALKAVFQKKINELEMRSLRAQMNPHFIFNSLSSINRYIVKSDHRTASNYLTKFSKLIRMILDNSALDVISVEKELQTLQLYIDMEELRFDHAFTYKIEVDDAIDEEETYIPSMLLQPYVENAIWHGLMHKEEGGGILLIKLVLLSPTLLMACIEDNGVGREKAIALKSKEALKKKSYGMQISHDRLELLNRQKQESPGVVIEDVINDEGTVNGTRVVLHIPIQNKQH